MTKSEIDDLMRDNGIVVVGEAVYALCNLIEAKERDRCAQIADAFAEGSRSARTIAEEVRKGTE